MKRGCTKTAVLWLASCVGAFALTCSSGNILEEGEVDFVKALDQSTSANRSSDTVGSVTIEGITDHVGTAKINNKGAAHGANKAGVRFKLDSKSSLGNNNGTIDNPEVRLKNYQTVTYTFSHGVVFSEPVTLKDLDSSSNEKYVDAATLVFVDTDGVIHAPDASVIGSKLMAFDVNVDAQPSSVTLPATLKGYAPNVYKGVSNTNTNYWVSWDLSQSTISKLVIVYWNNQPGTRASGAQGISLDSPLKFESCIATKDDNRTEQHIVPAPAIALVKYIARVSDENNNTLIDEGDIVYYGFTVKNRGNVTLYDITIKDENANIFGGTLAKLDVNESDEKTFYATHIVTEEDVNAGGVENSAIVHAKDENGNEIYDVSDTGTDPYLVKIEHPKDTETSSPLGVNENSDTDLEDDPTTLLIDIKAAHIGDLFWIDENRNGRKDDAEKVVKGGVVELYDKAGNPVTDAYGKHTVVTDENGKYGFDVVPGRTYVLKFVLPDEYIAENYEFVGKNIDEDGSFVLEVTPHSGNNILTLDAAIGCGCDNAPIQANNANALNRMGNILMLLMLLAIGIMFVKREQV